MPKKIPPEITAINRSPVRETRLDRFLRIPLTLGFLAVAVVLWLSGSDATTLLVLAVPALLLAALAWFGLTGSPEPSRYTVTTSCIVKENGSLRQELAFTDISGYRVYKQHITLFSKVGDQAFMSLKFVDKGPFGQLREWIRVEYPDLAKQEADAKKAALRQDQELGPTLELRDKAIRNSRRVAYGLNIAGVLTLPLLYFSESGYWSIPALVVPGLIPVALWLFPSALRIREHKTSPYPTFVLAFWLPLVGLLLRSASSGNQLDFEPLLRPAGLVALVYAGALLIGSHRAVARGESRVALFLAIAWRAVLYGWAAIFFFNREFENVSATTFRTQVMRKYSTHRKSTSYYLVVNPSGPVRTEKNLKVSRQYYDRTAPGDTVPITLHPGWLGASWFVVPGP